MPIFPIFALSKRKYGIRVVFMDTRQGLKMELRAELNLKTIMVAENKEAADSILNSEVSDIVLNTNLSKEKFLKEPEECPTNFLKNDDYDWDRRIIEKRDPASQRLEEWYEDKNTLCYAVGMPLRNKDLKLITDIEDIKKIRNTIPLMQVPVKDGQVYENLYYAEPYEGLIFNTEMPEKVIKRAKACLVDFFARELSEDSEMEITMIMKHAYEEYDNMCSLYVKLNLDVSDYYNGQAREQLMTVQQKLGENFLVLPNHRMGFYGVSLDTVEHSGLLKQNMGYVDELTNGGITISQLAALENAVESGKINQLLAAAKEKGLVLGDAVYNELAKMGVSPNI